MVDYGGVVIRGVQTTLTYVSVLFIGAALTIYPKQDPLLDPSVCKKLGRITMVIFMPSLIAVSLGQNLSIDLMANGAWVLSAWGLVHIMVNFLIALAVRCVVQPPKFFQTEFVLALISTNGLGLPLILMEPLCQTEPLSNMNFGSDGEQDAFQRATAFLFIYNLVWIVYLMGVCSYNLKPPSTGSEDSNSFMTFVVDSNPPAMVAAYVGMGIGLVQPVREVFFGEEAELLFVASSARLISGPMIGVLSLLVGSTLGNTAIAFLKSRTEAMGCGPSSSKNRESAEVGAVVEAYQLDGTGKQVTDSMQVVTDSPVINPGSQASPASGSPCSSGRSCCAPAADLSPTSQNTITSPVKDVPIEDVVVEAGDELVEDTDAEMSGWQMASFVLVKMVLMPVVNVTLVLIGADLTIPNTMSENDRKLMKFILVLECAGPSADTVMGICLQFGKFRSCEILSRAYLLQYLLGTLTITVAVCVGFASVFE